MKRSQRVKVWIQENRHSSVSAPSGWQKVFVLLGAIALLVGLSGWAIVQVQPGTPPLPVAVESPAAPPRPTIPTAIQQELRAIALAAPPSPPSPPAPPVYPSPSRFGHLPYSEAPDTDLMIIGSSTRYGTQEFEQLRTEGGLALLRMIERARRDGIWLVPVSAFRSVARQEELFAWQADHTGSEAAAAWTVAPPGYSEHHTGYAVDLADGNARAKDISFAFRETDAYRWLLRHAHRFGFELSFLPNNSQGVAFEPWHWRYVGSPEAAAMFSQAQAWEQSRD